VLKLSLVELEVSFIMFLLAVGDHLSCGVATTSAGGDDSKLPQELAGCPSIPSLNINMKYYFQAPRIGQCTVKLWANGAHGFVMPKKVEISTPSSAKASYTYRTLNEAEFVHVSGKSLMRIAIAQFLANPTQLGKSVELDSTMTMFDGPLRRTASWPRLNPVRRLVSQ
jgi:hypothetical protein